MYAGKFVFSQVMDHLPLHTYRRCVSRYRGERYVKKIFSVHSARVRAKRPFDGLPLFVSARIAFPHLGLQARFQSLTRSGDTVRLRLPRFHGASARSTDSYSDEGIYVSDDKAPRFSRSGRTLPRDFGPNDHVAKVHMPEQLYSDLSALAGIEGKGLSEYLRDRLMEFAYGELEAVRLRTYRESRQ